MNSFALVVGEGATELRAAHALLSALRADVSSTSFLDLGGSERFWTRAAAYNQAAEKAARLILGIADLESEPCAAGLIASALPDRHKRFVLRISVRMTESWMLADAENLANFLRVRRGSLPPHPDRLDHPKRELVDLARKSTRSEIRSDMVPGRGSRGIVGPGYSLQIADFLSHHWRPLQAQRHSDSLRRAIAAIKRAITGD